MGYPAVRCYCYIRVLNIQPNKMVGVLGEHGEFDIERLAASKDMQLLASASHDNTVKIWDLSILVDDDEDIEEIAEEEEKKKEAEAHGATIAGNKTSSGSDSDDSEEDSDSDSDGGGKKKKRRRKEEMKKNKGQHKIEPKKKHQQPQGSNFFSDLL